VERSYGSFSRSFSLANTVNAEAIKADYKNGVLTLSIPKREEAKPKQIKLMWRRPPWLLPRAAKARIVQTAKSSWDSIGLAFAPAPFLQLDREARNHAAFDKMTVKAQEALQAARTSLRATRISPSSPCTFSPL